MRIIETENYQRMSSIAADMVADVINSNKNPVLGLATGSTPIGMYDELAEMYGRGELDFSSVSTVNLDEYVGLEDEDSQSYHYFMDQHLFSKVNISRERIWLPNGRAEDLEEECRRYDAVIKSLGGIDIQLLGMGHNGHIGFNEPSRVFSEGTNCVTLTEETLDANKRFFESKDQVPRKALTMGIGTIMSAKKILIIVNGRAKAETLAKVVHGPVTPQVPASILRTHKDVVLIADREALSLCR